jgi:hypothetical protein
MAEEEADILWEDDLAATQSHRERYILVALTVFAGLLSLLGIFIGLLAPHPRTSFEGFAFGLFAVSLWFVVIETGVLWLAWRSRWAADHPHARFGPVALSGGGLLLLILIIELMALSAIAGPLSSWSWAMLTICLVITVTLLIWELLAFRRSILDGAWRRSD